MSPSLTRSGPVKARQARWLSLASALCTSTLASQVHAQDAGTEPPAAAAPEQPEPEQPAAPEQSAAPEQPAESEQPAAPEQPEPEQPAAPEQSAAPEEPAETPTEPEAGAPDMADEEELEFSATAEVTAPPREPTKHTVDQEILTRVPGTRGDALRAIEIMPGVSRTPYASSDQAPMLRGSSGDESLVLLDGAQVPLIYHFGGLTSFFNSNLLERVELYPGNYSARYGRAAGGLVEARVRDPRTDHFHVKVELSAIDSQALVESPLGKNTSVALAARRSNIDFFFKALVPEDAFSVLAAPVYWDYQAILVHRFNERHKLRALVYGSSDSLSLQFSDSAPEDPALRGAAEAKMAFHRAQLESINKFSEVVEHNAVLSVGPYYGHQNLGGISNEFDYWDINLRSWSRAPTCSSCWAMAATSVQPQSKLRVCPAMTRSPGKSTSRSINRTSSRFDLPPTQKRPFGPSIRGSSCPEYAWTTWPTVASGPWIRA